MPKSVFISYSRKQGEWVWDRLVPCLKAGGADVLIDREHFEAARRSTARSTRCRIGPSSTCWCSRPEYLVPASHCQRELERAIQRDPEFNKGLAIPVKRVACDLPAAIRRPDPLYVDLTDDQKEDPWDLLLRKCEADLGTPAPQWLKARDDIRRYLTRGESVNLTVQGKVRWKPLIDDLRRDPSLADLREVDLRNPETYARKALVEAILAACGIPGPVPDKPHDLVELGRALRLRPGAAHLALTHFDHVAHRADYEIDLFSALRYEMTESRKLVLLIQSQKPFLTLLPKEHPLSSITTPQDRRTEGEAMTPRPLGQIRLRPSDHLSALWWLGLLYRRPARFRDALKGMFTAGSDAIVAFCFYLHSLPYILILIAAGRYLRVWGPGIAS